MENCSLYDPNPKCLYETRRQAVDTSTPCTRSKKTTQLTHRVVSAAGHVAHDHIGDWQDLPVFRLLDEDGHSPGHQLAVVLYPLRPGDELPVRVVSCSDQSQRSAAAAAEHHALR